MGEEDKPLYQQQEQSSLSSPPPAQAGYAAPPPQQYPPPQYPNAPYPPPQQGYQYPPGYQQVPHTAPMGSAQAPLLAQDIRFRETPVVCTCPFCGNNGATITEYVNGLLTALSVGGLCLIGCWLGCCLIPLAVDACKDVEHQCASCHRVIGVYRRIS